ncbi:diuretic hormone receptor-like, partial [Stegodyphus dumicola]|uniref:diuretic hormone receptor-like n=1 Tax=Stegodyphus dumicola TaxID=202533 RepID=UPI0015B2871E
IPAFVAAAWAIVKGAAGGASDEPLAQRGCPWQNKDYYDYVFSCPVMLVLLINIFFLAKIMWVLITKLRASNTVESRQYRKAAKALLVLIPLLGVTYIIVIATPSDPVAEVVFVYIQATLLSIQGFVVAVLYCFLNGEVQNSLKHHLERWRTQKSVGKSPRHSVGHLSPHQGESMALYSTKSVRDSCTSFTTTTTVVNVPNRSPNTRRSGSSNHLAVQDDML